MTKRSIAFIITAGACLIGNSLSAWGSCGWNTFGASFLGSTLGTLVGNACYSPCYAAPCYVTRRVYYEPVYEPCATRVVVKEKIRNPCRGGRYVKKTIYKPASYRRRHYVITDDCCW